MKALTELLSRARSPLAVKLGLLVALGGIVLDQATQELAERRLERGVFVPWLSDAVGWQLVYNPGGAFGLPAPPWVFLVVTLLVIAIVARTLPSSPSLLQAAAYGLLLSGAVGNVLDRLLRAGDPERSVIGGYVVDFVAWGAWPRFNVADSCITVGFVLLVVALWREERQAAREAGDGDDAGAGGATDPDPSNGSDASVEPDVSAEPDASAEPRDGAAAPDAQRRGGR